MKRFLIIKAVDSRACIQLKGARNLKQAWLLLEGEYGVICNSREQGLVIPDVFFIIVFPDFFLELFFRSGGRAPI